MLIKNGNYLLRINQSPGHRSLHRFCDENELRPDFPELLDVLFTQNCNYGCSFCYLGCTEDGGHADVEFAQTALSTVPDWVEINCAGGNIIRHPQWKELPKIFSRFRSFNTTINPLVFDEVHFSDFYGFTAVGISINNDAVFSKYEYPIQALNNNSYVAVQIIPEMIGVAETRQILNRCASWKLPVLFLGYKTVGRGANQTVPHLTDEELSSLISYIQEKEITLSVDTTFVSNYKKQLETLLTENLDDIQEGKFSFYMDLVHGYCSKSSWNTEKQFQLSDIKTMFKNVRS